MSIYFCGGSLAVARGNVMKANTTAADTILDRLVHAGVRFELKGTSLRQKVCGKVKADLFIH